MKESKRIVDVEFNIKVSEKLNENIKLFWKKEEGIGCEN